MSTCFHFLIEIFNIILEMMETVDKDCLYAAFFEEAWYRAKVTDVRGDEAEIYFVDRGDNGQVKTSELRKLPAQFKRLPMQVYTDPYDIYDFSRWTNMSVRNMRLKLGKI